MCHSRPECPMMITIAMDEWVLPTQDFPMMTYVNVAHGRMSAAVVGDARTVFVESRWMCSVESIHLDFVLVAFVDSVWRNCTTRNCLLARPDYCIRHLFDRSHRESCPRIEHSFARCCSPDRTDGPGVS